MYYLISQLIFYNFKQNIILFSLSLGVNIKKLILILFIGLPCFLSFLLLNKYQYFITNLSISFNFDIAILLHIFEIFEM